MTGRPRGRRGAALRSAKAKRSNSARHALPVVIEVDTSRAGRAGRPFAERLLGVARRALAALGLSGVTLEISLVRDADIRTLNREWRHKDRPTDVLSFPAGDPAAPGPRPLGDVIISLDTARRAAAELETTVEGELDLYLVHGLLHLLGFDHEDREDAREMAHAERRLLGLNGMLARSGEG